MIFLGGADVHPASHDEDYQSTGSQATPPKMHMNELVFTDCYELTDVVI